MKINNWKAIMLGLSEKSSKVIKIIYLYKLLSNKNKLKIYIINKLYNQYIPYSMMVSKNDCCWLFRRYWGFPINIRIRLKIDRSSLLKSYFSLYSKVYLNYVDAFLILVK